MSIGIAFLHQVDLPGLSLTMKIVAVNNNAEMFLFGYIGADITVREFMTSLRDMESKYPNITMLINSEGGDMFQGLPLYNNLCKSPSYITADIQGLAASMITIVMCGAKKIRAASNAKFMVHGPQGGDFTNIEGLESLVGVMKSLRADMAQVYAKRTGKTEQWILDNWLTDGKNHWFSAQEAKDVGLIDEVYEVQSSLSVQMNWPLRRIAAVYNEGLNGTAQDPAPGSSNNNFLNQTEPSMKKIIAVLTGSKLVQLPESATEELVAESTQTLVNQLKQREQTITEKDTTLVAKDAEITRLTNELTVAKTAGLKKNGEALVAAAITAGKIVAAQKDNYEKLATASEEGYNNVKALFDSMQPYSPVVNQLKVSTGGGNTAPQVYASHKDEFDKRAEAGTLEALKAENFEHFKMVYKAGTGKDFKG